MPKTKGVIAAGHPATAEAGKLVLEAGGNAMDAAIAAGFAACVAEPLLTSLGGGGFMLVHDTESGQNQLLDFFVAMPGKGLDKSRAISKMIPTPVDFGSTVQMFHGGHSTVAVPGVALGLCEAHSRYGTMPLSELIQPAVHLARNGVVQTEQQEYLNLILKGVFELSSDMRKCFYKDGNLLKQGDKLFNPDIAGSLQDIASTKGQTLIGGDIASAILKEVEAGGGLITAEDLAAYKVISRQPIESSYRSYQIYTNPPPSSGGALIAHTLKLLEKYDLASISYGSFEYLQHLIEAMMRTNAVRRKRLDAYINDGDVLDWLLADAKMHDDHIRLSSRLGNTTHFSVMDSLGNAVSMTSSNGSGSGIAVPGTGIFLNNILGEEDLNPAGFYKHSIGHRPTSMMSPTIILENGKPRLAVGSAGSNRIRSAVLQTILNVLDQQLPIESAVSAPRIHCEGELVEIEGGFVDAETTKLARFGYNVNVWKERNLFFGGVQAVEHNLVTGNMSGAGDPRRGGVSVMAT